ncbi:MAG: hypothetical protein ER33_16115 [Cyanobium sp. CACIAM 14]|nr:MAG: hypothetical protein ER33_16115 [Cyanobium sp. CACIAM 14]
MHAWEKQIAAGKAIRTNLARTDQGHWEPPADRPDPIDLLGESNRGRRADLIPIRYGRMLSSPLAFLRGAASLMASDLGSAPTTGIEVQVCGDCHLMNFGGYATPERNLLFDVNDFDETFRAPWEWDLKRLVTSFVLAGRSNRINEEESQLAAIACARSYRQHLRNYSRRTPLEVWYERLGMDRLSEMVPDLTSKKQRAKLASFSHKHLVAHHFPNIITTAAGSPRFVDQPPLFFHIEDEEEQRRLLEAIEDYHASLPEDRRFLLSRYRLVDVAVKVVGVGSVGTHCYVALFVSELDDVLILQVKEARHSVLEPYCHQALCDNQGQRVVMGQRLMQSASDLFLSWARSRHGLDFYVRQLRDMKFSIPVEGFTAVQLHRYGQACGWALARAHAKGGDAGRISGYLGKGDVFDQAMGFFARAYADQTERDHEALQKAVHSGRAQAIKEAN